MILRLNMDCPIGPDTYVGDCQLKFLSTPKSLFHKTERKKSYFFVSKLIISDHTQLKGQCFPTKDNCTKGRFFGALKKSTKLEGEGGANLTKFGEEYKTGNRLFSLHRFFYRLILA